MRVATGVNCTIDDLMDVYPIREPVAEAFLEILFDSVWRRTPIQDVPPEVAEEMIDQATTEVFCNEQE